MSETSEVNWNFSALRVLSDFGDEAVPEFYLVVIGSIYLVSRAVVILRVTVCK